MSATLTPFSAGARPGDPRGRVRDARPDLHPETSAFRAAVVLLAGPEAGFNVDRIATRCRLPRPWTAACVRRLIDNGVWTGGRAAYPWNDADDPRFWNDAAVAEGRLLRRTLPDGRVQWAPPGRWEKAYDFVGPQSDPGGAVLYLDPAADLTDPPAPAADASAGVFPGAARIVDEWDEEPDRRMSTAGVPELFPGAAWLR